MAMRLACDGTRPRVGGFAAYSSSEYFVGTMSFLVDSARYFLEYFDLEVEVVSAEYGASSGAAGVTGAGGTSTGVPFGSLVGVGPPVLCEIISQLAQRRSTGSCLQQGW